MGRFSETNIANTSRDDSSMSEYSQLLSASRTSLIGLRNGKLCGTGYVFLTSVV